MPCRPKLSSGTQPISVVSVPKSRFSEIDSLRAVACLAVTVYHVIWQFNKVAGSGVWLYDFLGEGGNGFEGFLVFFMISGYVIPGSLRGERVEAMKCFAFARFFRLYPSFWIVLVIGSLGKYTTLWNARFLWGLTMMPSLAGVEVVLGHFWALEVTAILYIFISSLYLVFGNLRLKVIFPLYLVCLTLSFSRVAVPAGRGFWGRLPLFLSLFFFGACAREVIRLDARHKVSARKTKLPRCVGIGIVTGVMLIVPLYRMYLAISLGDGSLLRQFLFLFVWIFLFLFWVILLPVKMPFLKGLGKASYSIYLWHMIIIHAVIVSIQHGYAEVLRGWSLPVYVAVFLPICLVCGSLAYRWVEEPIGRLGKRIASR